LFFVNAKIKSKLKKQKKAKEKEIFTIKEKLAD